MASPPLGTPDIQANARKVFTTLQAHGIALVGADLGYALMTSSKTALARIFTTKSRAASKRHPLMGTFSLLSSVLILSDFQLEVIKSLTQDFNMPLAVVGRFRKDHQLVKNLEANGVLDESSGVATGSEKEEEEEEKTLMITTNVGNLCMAISHLCETEGNCLPLQGSSANPSGTGNRYRVEDIPSEIIDLADVTIDNGLSKYADHGRGATILDCSGKGEKDIGVFRIGALYDVLGDLLKRFWGVELPEDPGQEGQSRFGHLKVLPEVESLKQLREQQEEKSGA